MIPLPFLIVVSWLLIYIYSASPTSVSLPLSFQIIRFSRFLIAVHDHWSHFSSPSFSFQTILFFLDCLPFLMMDLLDSDLLWLIFLKLQPTDLQHCWMTCSRWKRVIETSTFIQDHYLSHQWPPTEGFLVFSNAYYDREVVPSIFDQFLHNLEMPLPLPDEIRGYRLCCILNGVLCLSNYDPPYYVLLWNPLLHHYRRIPVDDYGCTSLAWSENDLLLIHIWKSNHYTEAETVWLRSRSSAWIQVPLDIHLGITGYSSEVILHGIPYFNSIFRSTFQRINRYVAFHPTTRNFTILDLPVQTNGNDPRNLVEIHQHTCLITMHQQSVIQIYQLNGNTWTRIINCVCHPWMGIEDILTSTPSGELIMAVNGVLAAFDPNTDVFTTLNEEEFIYLYQRCYHFRYSIIRCRLFGA